MKKIITAILLITFVVYCKAQSTVQQLINLAGNPQGNFYHIAVQADSALQTSSLDTSESGDAMIFSRWKWFWKSRMGDVIDQSQEGKFSHYFDVLTSIAQSPVCTSSSPYPANWNLLGPVQLPRQEMGRIDAIARDPNNSTIVYSGAPNSGLWRTNDITATTPIWELCCVIF